MSLIITGVLSMCPLQNTGYTALMFACKGGHLDTVMILMGHVADPLIRNSVHIVVI